jgi:hypothetical protein
MCEARVCLAFQEKLDDFATDIPVPIFGLDNTGEIY